MRGVRTKAFVLKKKILPGQDMLITLLSEDMGKITVFAKGIKKITSRRGPHIQTGNLLDILLHNSDIHLYLQETVLISGFSAIKESQGKLSYQYALFYVLDRLLPEQEKEKTIYLLTTKFLIELSSSGNFGQKQMEYYLNSIVRHLGYSKEKKSYSQLRELFTELTNEQFPNFVRK